MLDVGISTYLRLGGTYLGWGRGYLPWMEGVPTLDGGRSTYLGQGGGGTYPGQVMLWAVRLLWLPPGGLSCFVKFKRIPVFQSTISCVGDRDSTTV